MTEHALLSPSAAARWTRCTMAPHREQEYPDTTSPAAELGTKAHRILEDWLSRNALPGPEDQEFIDNLVSVVQYVRNRQNQGMDLAVEARVDCGVPMGLLPGIMWGTSDVVLKSNGADNVIEILDLKYGYNYVEVQDNLQLMLYAGGVLGEMPEQDYWVRMTIAQPNCPGHDPIRSWEIRANELAQRLMEIAESVNKVYINPEYNPGETQCRWCAARNDCEARGKHIRAEIEQHFQPVGQAMQEGAKPGPQELSDLMFKLPEIENWIHDIKAEAYRQADAHNLPGWKLVQGRKSRKWSNDEDALVKIQKMRVNGKALGLDVAAPRKVLSPAQAEKVSGLTKKQKEALAGLQTVSYGTPALVPEADPRPALSVDVESYFMNETEKAENG